MSKSPVYIGAGSDALTQVSAQNIIDNANDISLKLQTIEEWVSLTDGTTVFDFVDNVDTNEYSAKEYAQGIAATGGTAKQWALGGGSHVEATEVITGKYSAKKYATDAAASASTAEGYVDAFDDDYLGSHTTAAREVGANVGKDNDGDALADGALYYDTTLEVMKVWNDTGSVWKQLTPTTENQTQIDTLTKGYDGTTATSGTNLNIVQVDTVADSIANVNTVGGISANVTTVAGIASDVTAVVADATDIGVVAGKATEIGRLGTLDAVADMALLAIPAVITDMDILGSTTVTDDMALLAIPSVITDMDLLGASGVIGNIATVAGVSANVTTVAGVSANVTTVAGVSSNVTTAATNITSINTVASNVADINDYGDKYQISDFTENGGAGPDEDGGGNALAKGDMAFDTTLNVLRIYNGSVWSSGVNTTSGVIVKQEYTANGSTKHYVLTHEQDMEIVYLNGVKLLAGDASNNNDYFSVSGGSSTTYVGDGNAATHIYFHTAPANTYVISVVAWGASANVLAVPKGGGAFSGAVTFGAASQFNNAVTVGVDGTGHDFTLYGETSGKYAKWNQASDIFFLKDSTNLAFGDSTDMNLYHDGTNSYIDNSTGSLNIAVSDSGIAVNIGHTTSETTINGNLTVNGTTTTINSTTLSVDDKNIEMGSVASPSDSTADGGGFTLKGATDKTILWTNSLDSWVYNQGITVGVDGTGYDVTFFAASSGSFWKWDQANDRVVTIGGLQQTGTITVGEDDHGHDVIFYGATSGSWMLWDEGQDSLQLTDSSPLKIGDSFDMQLYHDGANSYITNSGGQMNFCTLTSGMYVNIGHTTSETTVNDNLTVIGDLTINGTTTFNESGGDVDFRIESNDKERMFFVDASENKIGINMPIGKSPTRDLHLHSVNGGYIGMTTDDETDGTLIGYNGSGSFLIDNLENSPMYFYTNGAVRLSIAAGGDVTIANNLTVAGNTNVGTVTAGTWNGTTIAIANGGTGGTTAASARSGLELNTGDSPTFVNLTLSGDLNGTGDFNWDSNTLFVDSSASKVGIGLTNPDAPLEISASQSGFNADAHLKLSNLDNTANDNHVGIMYQSSSNNGEGKAWFGIDNYISEGRGRFVWMLENTTSTSAVVDESDEVMYLDRDGELSVQGNLIKGSGSFKIDHPLPSMKDTHKLVHSFTESPRADLIYRGTVALVDGSATIDLDTEIGMTSGTWILLCRDEQVFTSNETGWNHVRGLVSGSILSIECEEANCTDTISWMVVAERHDQHMYDTKWTDENGKPILEPEKTEREIQRQKAKLEAA